MALLVEGLAVGGETSIEEYIIGPADELDEDQDPSAQKEHITLYGPEEGLSWIARPVTGQSRVSLVSRQGSLVNQGLPGMDPLVSLFGSMHEKMPETGSMRSMLFPNFGSMFSTADHPHIKNEEWDEENLQVEGEDYNNYDGDGADSDDNLHSPLISRQTTSLEKDMVAPQSHGSVIMRRHSSLMQGNGVDSTGIGGGWQLAWKWSEREGEDGKKEGGFKRIYLHQEGGPGSRRGSLVSIAGGDVPLGGDYIQAAALVSQPALYSKELTGQHTAGPAMAHPSAESSAKSSILDALRDPGVKRALFVGIGLQILQQV